jgi:serine/threonine protein kinase
LSQPSSDAEVTSRACGSTYPTLSRGLREGRVVAGRYRVETLIGSGGMGLVYAATHVVLGTGLALKVLRPELGEHPDFPGRFLNEARSTAAIRSRHVVRVFDAGRMETGLPFLAMERLQGIDLAALVGSQGALPPRAAVDYVMQACVGLGEAHAVGLVHRDIKPSNLFVASDGARAARIMILDFGISRWDSEPSERVADQVLGSPSYASPEQIDDGSGVDRRTDIWSLGVVLYELLTGRSPFAQPSVSQTFSRVLRGPVPRLRDARPELHDGLAAIVARCLQRQREARFLSVLELRTALAPFATSGASGVRVRAQLPAVWRSAGRVCPEPAARAAAASTGDAPALRTLLFGSDVHGALRLRG